MIEVIGLYLLRENGFLICALFLISCCSETDTDEAVQRVNFTIPGHNAPEHVIKITHLVCSSCKSEPSSSDDIMILGLAAMPLKPQSRLVLGPTLVRLIDG